MAEATCAWCGATFQRRRSDQRCCDKACGKKYANNVQRRKYPCTCRVCGTEWVATKPSQVCSSECLGVEHAHRIAGREPNPLRNESSRRRADEPVAPASEVPGFANPLAVRVGLYVSADDLPCEGWPAEFRSDVVERVLGYLPLDD